MTDRVNALVVVLDKDIRTDDVEALVNAIKQLRCVASVEQNVSDLEAHVAYTRARADLQERLWKALQDKPQ